MRLVERSGVIALLLLALAGCRSLSCNAPPSYGSDSSVPPLEVPLGLDAPDTRNALRVPDLSEPERPRSKHDPCLDEPPSYFSDRRVGERPADDSKGQQ